MADILRGLGLLWLCAGLVNICRDKGNRVWDQQVSSSLLIAVVTERDDVPVLVSRACLLNMPSCSGGASAVGQTAVHGSLAAEVLPMSKPAATAAFLLRFAIQVSDSQRLSPVHLQGTKAQSHCHEIAGKEPVPDSHPGLRRLKRRSWRGCSAFSGALPYRGRFRKRIINYAKPFAGCVAA